MDNPISSAKLPSSTSPTIGARSFTPINNINVYIKIAKMKLAIGPAAAIIALAPADALENELPIPIFLSELPSIYPLSPSIWT